MSLKEILKKLQNLPERTRKIILWSTVIILGFCLIFFWLRGFQQKIESFEGKEILEEIKLPDLENLYKQQ